MVVGKNHASGKDAGHGPKGKRQIQEGVCSRFVFCDFVRATHFRAFYQRLPQGTMGEYGKSIIVPPNPAFC